MDKISEFLRNEHLDFLFRRIIPDKKSLRFLHWNLFSILIPLKATFCWQVALKIYVFYKLAFKIFTSSLPHSSNSLSHCAMAGGFYSHYTMHCRQKKIRQGYNISMQWTNFWQPTVRVQQNIFEKNSKGSLQLTSSRFSWHLLGNRKFGQNIRTVCYDLDVFFRLAVYIKRSYFLQFVWNFAWRRRVYWFFW